MDNRILALEKQNQIKETLSSGFRIANSIQYCDLIRELKPKLGIRLYGDLKQIGFIRNRFIHGNITSFNFGVIKSAQDFEQFCDEVSMQISELLSITQNATFSSSETPKHSFTSTSTSQEETILKEETHQEPVAEASKPPVTEAFDKDALFDLLEGVIKIGRALF